MRLLMFWKLLLIAMVLAFLSLEVSGSSSTSDVDGSKGMRKRDKANNILRRGKDIVKEHTIGKIRRKHSSGVKEVPRKPDPRVAPVPPPLPGAPVTGVHDPGYVVSHPGHKEQDSRTGHGFSGTQNLFRHNTEKINQ